jgi:hypothetical protein
MMESEDGRFNSSDHDARKVTNVINQYFKLGWRIIPLHGKKPFIEGWQNLRLALEEFQANYREGDNVGVITGWLKEGGLALIALDVDELFETSLNEAKGDVSLLRSWLEQILASGKIAVVGDGPNYIRCRCPLPTHGSQDLHPSFAINKAKFYAVCLKEGIVLKPNRRSDFGQPVSTLEITS